jgi:hypothetical protein
MGTNRGGVNGPPGGRASSERSATENAAAEGSDPGAAGRSERRTGTGEIAADSGEPAATLASLFGGQAFAADVDRLVDELYRRLERKRETERAGGRR